jgi:hypothetical protein
MPTVQYLIAQKNKSFAVAVMLLSLFCCHGFAQQTPAPAPKADATTAPKPANPSPAADAAKPAASEAAPEEKGPERAIAIDPKSGLPLYETIEEDWSSLQIGGSKLEPEAPLVGMVDEQPTFTRTLVQVKWRPGDPIDLWVVLPKGVKNPPVVLYLYNFTDDTDRFRNDGWCDRTTSGGVAAVGFVSALSGHRFHDRPLKQWFISEFQESLGSTVHDVKFILDYLATRHDVDMNRVGMFGESSGGAIAILAAAADPRIKVVDTLDPWGDWPNFFAKANFLQDDPNKALYVTPAFLKSVAPLDPVKWLPDLKIPVRVQQVRQNESVPIESKESIKNAAPKQTEVVRFEAVRDLQIREGQGQLFEWIKTHLPPANATPAPADTRKTSVASEATPKADQSKSAAQR